MKLIEINKIKKGVKDYWIEQISKISDLNLDFNEYQEYINNYIKYNYELILLINNLPYSYSEINCKIGQWIVHENADIIDGYYVPKYECSCCHTWQDDDSNFCPNCGMDMRERKDKNNEYNTNNN